MSKTRTSNGKRGGLLEGKPHYDKDGNSLGGIKAVVTDAGGKPVELEGGEVIINKEASKKYWKELSKINQSAGNGVPILPPDGAVTDEDPEEFGDGGNIIEFNPNHLPNKWITEYAKQIKKDHPEIWAKGGNIFGNEAFKNLCRVRERGHWLDSEEWMYIKWRSYVARHKKDFRIEGVVAMLKWCDKVDKGWGYMKNLIEKEIATLEKKKNPSAFKQALKEKEMSKMARGGKTCATCDNCQVLDKNGKPAIDEKSLRKMEKCIMKLTQTKDLNLNANGKYKLARRKLHKKIIDEFKKNAVCITKGQPIAILMGGSPASGKSSFLKKYRPFLLQEEILKVDADEIRARLPEYKGYNATQTHQETKDIVTTLISDKNIGVPCDFDLIYDGTMNNVRSYKPLIELLRSRNYKIFIVYMDKVPKDVIMQRMKDRYVKTGRFVPAEVVDDFFKKGKSAFEELKPLVDGYLVIDGSNQDYDIIEKGGMQLPKDRAYSKLGEKISPEELEKIEYKRGGNINISEYKGTITDDSAEYILKSLGYDFQSQYDTISGLRFFGTLEEVKNAQKDLLKYNIESSVSEEGTIGYKELRIPNQVVEYKDGGNIDKKDSVELDIPLLIRVMEFAREDVKSDPELHNVVERLIEIRDKGVLTMKDYDFIADLKKKEKFSQIERKYANGGTVLLAPNGNPSNLTPEQYKLVRTPEFKAWFGDWENDPENASKVVDENGEPLVCYHGSDNKFNTFDIEKIYRAGLGKGFYFTSNYEKANNYGINVFAVFLKIIIPAIVKGSNSESDLKDLLKLSSTSTEEEIRNKAIYLNYDGVIKLNKKNEFSEVVVFNSNQIKLADGTNTTFDPNNDDIRFETGGTVLLAPNGKPSNLTTEQHKLVRTPEFKAWFGDWENDPKNASKIVDENGEPLVMYSGSPYQFTTFKSNEIEVDKDDKEFKSRFWFTTNRELAETYSRKATGNIGTIYEAFLNIKNPKYDFNLYAEDKEDGSIELRNRKIWVAIATLSEQIKLADGTNTTFDGNNPDIRFETGGTVLLSPNGNPSNLTPEQYKLVRTPEFKAWFGDWENDPENASKVVDENGEPQVVYHGTNAEFNQFDITKLWTNIAKPSYDAPNGFYFAKEKSLSSKYGKNLKEVFIGKGDLLLNNKKAVVTDNPNQIKLADGTNTTFDGNNPDIRFETGGNIEQKLKDIKSVPYNELLRNIQDSYKELGAEVGVKGHTKDGEPIIGYLPYQYDYMHTSDITNKKIRFFIDLGEGKLVHPSEVNPKFSVSEQKRLEQTADQFYRDGLENYNTSIENLKKNQELDLAKESLSKALNNGFEIENQYDGNDYFESNGSSILVNNKNGIRLNLSKYIERINGEAPKTKLSNLDLLKFKKEYLDKFEKGGLIAPNGKPSNLTPEQYKLVRTPKFKAWFGDWEKLIKTKIDDSGIDEVSLARLESGVSKVVDENGEPLVVYHGSNNDFNKFSLEYTATNTGNSGFLGRGFYFATNKMDAKNYGEIVKPYFLKSLKKLDLRNIEYKELAFLLPNLKMKSGKTWKDAFIEIDNIKSQIKSIEIEDLKNGFFNVHYEYKGNWGMIPRRNIHEIEADKGLGTIIYRLIEEDPDNIGAIGNYFNPITLSQEIKTQGFDSVMSDGTNIFDLGDEIVVFEPNQIKLADGTNTTFDPNNDDIRFETGGVVLLAPNGNPSDLTPEQYKLVRTPEFKDWFGDWENDPENASKVVDENGEPLVVYHNSGAKFNVFDKSKNNLSIYGEGLYFTNIENEYNKNGKYSYQVFLNLKTPLILDLENKNYEHDIYELLNFEREFELGAIIKNPPQRPRDVKLYGFGERTYYVVYNSNQIKLADGTNTTFDPNNDDIRFENGGKIQFTSTKSVSINVGNDLYKFQYKRGERGDTDKPVWFAKLVSINEKPAEGRLCFEPSYHAIIEGFSLKEVENLVFECFKENELWIMLEDEYGNEKEVIHVDGKYDPNTDNLFYRQGGLIAPNGNPTKLTPEQYKIVRTPEFKAWFGDWENFDYQKNKELKGSVIIDFRDYSDLEKEFTNEPLVLYHASNNEFNVFDIEKSDYRERGWFGKGFYFGESETQVRRYGKIIKPYFLKLSNPFYFSGHQKEFAEKFDLDYWENYDLYSNTIREKLIKLGYDGVVANSIWGAEYVAFYPNQIKLADGTNTTFDPNSDDIRYKRGGRTVAQTPAPKKERIYGSEKNKPKSSKDSSSAESIKFDEKTLTSIENKLKEHNESHPDVKVNLATAKAVVRRGMGAYSKSHRPTISGGQPNSRVAWGLARLNAFLYKAVHGESKSGKYSQDNDLLDELSIAHDKFKKGGELPKKNQNGNCYEVTGKMIIYGKTPDGKKIEYKGTPYLVHAQVTGQGAIEGLKYGHAWIEDDVFVYDYSNNRKLEVPKALYYKVGQIIKQQPIYFKYNFKDARKKMADTAHYGSWDLKTESGL